MILTNHFGVLITCPVPLIPLGKILALRLCAAPKEQAATAM